MKDFKVYQTSGMLNFLVSEASDVRKKEQTLSGNIISFVADEQTAVKIVANIDSETGLTGCNIYRTGVNIFDGEMENGDISETTGQNNGTSTSRYRSKNYIPVPSGEYTLYFKSPGRTGTVRVFLYDENKDFIRYESWSVNAERQIIFIQTKYIRFRYGTGSVAGDTQISINLPSTVTEYVPYDSISNSISFPAEVGSVTDGTLTIDYSGNVTLETGGQSYPLTSISPIETLIGDNNIWSDAVEVSVTYPI